MNPVRAVFEALTRDGAPVNMAIPARYLTEDPAVANDPNRYGVVPVNQHGNEHETESLGLAFYRADVDGTLWVPWSDVLALAIPGGDVYFDVVRPRRLAPFMVKGGDA